MRSNSDQSYTILSLGRREVGYLAIDKAGGRINILIVRISFYLAVEYFDSFSRRELVERGRIRRRGEGPRYQLS